MSADTAKIIKLATDLDNGQTKKVRFKYSAKDDVIDVILSKAPRANQVKPAHVQEMIHERVSPPEICHSDIMEASHPDSYFDYVIKVA